MAKIFFSKTFEVYFKVVCDDDDYKVRVEAETEEEAREQVLEDGFDLIYNGQAELLANLPSQGQIEVDEIKEVK